MFQASPMPLRAHCTRRWGGSRPAGRSLGYHLCRSVDHHDLEPGVGLTDGALKRMLERSGRILRGDDDW